ncbi:hypothetical protein RB195_024710 [Necator americanus]|uniref:DUF7083 domain-containing protein n=1 Tax=Necator americanus TaxID=51031 RepID=A0ABR1EP92_NECAM
MRLLNALHADGVPVKIVRLLDDMGQRTAAAVRTPPGCTTPFEVITVEASTKLQHVVDLVSQLAATYGLHLRPDKCKEMIWNSDEWIDSVQALAEDREGWAELCSMTAYLCKDADNGCTFDVWYNRYEDVISKDRATLDDVAKARLIISKLDTVASPTTFFLKEHAMFS